MVDLHTAPTTADEHDPRDTLQHRSRPGTAWSTGNVSEALPGVSTPLTWSWFFDSLDYGFRAAFAEMGIVPRSFVATPEDPNLAIWTCFRGRAAVNLDTFARIIANVPGTTISAWEKQILGVEREHAVKDTNRRVPIILAKAPVAVARHPAKLEAVRVEIRDHWSRFVAEHDAVAADIAATGDARPHLVWARRWFREAKTLFDRINHRHGVATQVAQGLYDAVRQLTERAGMPGLEAALTTGLASVEEVAVMTDLWEVSRERMTREAFLGRHGFHGPAEGEMATHTWREKPEYLDPVLRGYAAMPESDSPAAVARARADERAAATAKLLAALPASRRAGARLVLRLAAKHVPLREVGKNGFVQTTDTGRAAARIIGAALHRDGLLDDPADVFSLTWPEVAGDAPSDVATVAFRKARRAEYLNTSLPDSWIGQPVPIPLEPAEPPAEGPLTGLGVSPGTVEGTVRVVDSPETAELEPGEILVCHTTHPGWTSLFLVAAGLAIDVGGLMSHGAIVAREVGVPCVMNTVDGTRRLRTGDRVRVDGTAGTVEIL